MRIVWQPFAQPWCHQALAGRMACATAEQAPGHARGQHDMSLSEQGD